ncbi:MAG: histidine phosphatase family protein [Bacillota bacterium]|nr:histidine phosphatase family protein [Bacillota bacterium]
MIKDLYIIRHGEAAHHIGEALTGGWTNSGLTDKGRRQAEEAGKKLAPVLKGKSFDFYCSDLERAWDTADVIGRFIEKEPMAFRELRELNNGDAANLSRQEAEKIFIPAREPMMDWVPYPNAESWRMLNNRVFEFMDRIDETSKETVVAVTHGGTAIAIINWWLELDDQHISKTSFDINPCSITRLRINGWGEKTIARLNDTSHLAGVR